MKAFRIIAAGAALACTAAVTQAQTKQNGFSVILLLGQTWGSASDDGLPPAPGLRKALADVKDFLPYRNYRVLDTQWLRSGMTRMKGADDQEYDVTLEAGEFQRNGPGMQPYDPASGKPPVISVSFHLQETGAAQNSSEEFGRSVQTADLEKQLASLRAQLASAQGGPMVQEQKARIDRVERMIRLARARKLLDSRFEMAPGETVVVGTSKMGGGDKALVVLLTAVTTGGK